MAEETSRQHWILTAGIGAEAIGDARAGLGLQDPAAKVTPAPGLIVTLGANGRAKGIKRGRSNQRPVRPQVKEGAATGETL